MTFCESISEHVRAGFAGLWIQSHEHEEALEELTQLFQAHDWRLGTWDIDKGLSIGRSEAEGTPQAGKDPLAAIRSAQLLAAPEKMAMLVLKNFHRFLSSPEILQAVHHQINVGKRSGFSLAILSPVIQIPVELEKQFTVIEHGLPDRNQLQVIAGEIATESEDMKPADLEPVLDAAAGLTRMQAENAFSLSLARHGRIEPSTIWELKAQELKKSGLLELHRGTERFADLGGMEALKSFCLKALRHRQNSDANKYVSVRGRGVILLGVAGSGKSAFAKALGNETGRSTLTLDVGRLMGSLVGQTEHNMRQALKTIDAFGRAVLYADEVEKCLSGVQSSGMTDSGVSSRLFGSLLTWLNDHESDVFFVATCNDISRLPPEFTRAERFDGIFFCDLPSAVEKAAIWKMYLEKFGLSPTQKKPNDTDWTGAEIRSCCRLAALLDVPLVESAKNVVPVAVTASESVDRLRNWASGRCLSANSPGIYLRPGSTTAHRRRVQTQPEAN